MRSGARASSGPSRSSAFGWLCLFVAGILPLLALAVDAPATTGLVCVALAVLALAAGRVSGSAAVVARPPHRTAVGSADIELRLAGQATDPTHHPLRPRAPGLV